MGIKVDHVEVKNINPPQAILTAEGRKQSSILITEGEKKVAVLAAGQAEALIRRSEGNR